MVEGFDGVVPTFDELEDVTAKDSSSNDVKGKLLYQDKVTQSGFKTTGVLSATLAANAVTDKSGNGIVATSLTLGHNIVSATTGVEDITGKANTSGKTYGSSGANNAEMFDTGYGYRYLGSSPNNYITFNGETWRIIGVFSDPDSNGDTAPKMKIMRDASIGNIAWDTSGTYGSNN